MFGGHNVGEVVGGKTLTAYSGVNDHGHHLWVWTCLECKEERGPSTLAHMRRSTRCGACAFSRANNPRWKGYEELTGVWLQTYKYGAEKRGVTWLVTPEQIWSVWLLQEGRCAYTGWKLTHGVDASLDRIDNTRGYEPDNIQFVHRDINKMKSDFTEGRFLELCGAVR